MAEGLAQGVAEGPSGSRPAHRPKWHDSKDALWRNQLMTLHPTSGLSSSSVFGDDAWLSVNMIQAGWKNQAKIKPLEESDFEANGAGGIRPTFIGEGAYERDCYTWCGQPALGADLPTTGAWGVRLYAWWGMLAGGVGCKRSSPFAPPSAASQPAAAGADAYGSEGTWEWRATNNGPVTGTQWCKGFVQYSWREAVYDFPGAASLRHLADLSEDLWGLVRNGS